MFIKTFSRSPDPTANCCSLDSNAEIPAKCKTGMSTIGFGVLCSCRERDGLPVARPHSSYQSHISAGRIRCGKNGTASTATGKNGQSSTGFLRKWRPIFPPNISLAYISARHVTRVTVSAANYSLMCENYTITSKLFMNHKTAFPEPFLGKVTRKKLTAASAFVARCFIM